MSEESEAKKQLQNAWKKGDVKRAISILREHPNLVHGFKLDEAKPKVSFHMKHKDFCLSLFGSIPLGVFYGFLYFWLTPKIETDFPWLKFIGFGILVLFLAVIFGSFVSLPLKHRSLRLPAYVSGLSSGIGSFVYGILFSCKTYSVADAGVSFLEYFLTQSFLTFTAYSLSFLFMGALLAYFPSVLLTRLLIGIPRVDTPYQTSFVSKSNFEDFRKAFIYALEGHFFSLNNVPKSPPFLAHATKFLDSRSLDSYVVTFHVSKIDEGILTHMMVYLETIEAIKRDDFCERLALDLVNSVKGQVDLSLYPSENHKELSNFLMAFTSSRLEKWARNRENIRKLQRRFVYGLVGLAVMFFIYYYWDILAERITPTLGFLKEIVLIISAFVTVLSFLLGPGVLLKAWKRLKRKT